MGKTNIEWTDATWNPVTGCTKVSAGCKNCYAEGVANRFWAAQYPPTTADVDGAKIERPRRFTDVQCHADRLDEPLRWRKPRRVFVNSMSDLFHEDVPAEFIDRVFLTMMRASPSVVRLERSGFQQLPPRHTFQILTKRPERMLAYMTGGARDRIGATLCWPLTCVSLGVSVEDQRAADERIPLLLETPAAVRFLSCEPLLGPLEFSAVGKRSDAVRQLGKAALHGIDWAIVGGESGPGARPCDVAWIRSIVEQCKAASVPAFVKQLGAVPFAGDGRHTHVAGDRDYGVVCDQGDPCPHCGPRPVTRWSPLRLRDRKGGDPAEWPEDLRVREFPKGSA